MPRQLTLLLALLVAFGCDSTFNASRLDNDLANSTWLFERAESNDGIVEHNTNNERQASIVFGDRSENSDTYEVSGYNGCNAFSGKYTIDGESELLFTQIAQTYRACQEEEARIEEVFNRGIQGARTYSFDGDVLVIDAPGPAVKLRLVQAVAE